MNKNVVVVGRTKITELDFTPTELELLESMYSDVERQLAELGAKKDEIKENIHKQFEAEYGHQGQSIVSRVTGNTLQRVINITQDIDSDMVRKSVTPEVWEKITVAKVVPELFFSAIKMGDIIPRDVADAVADKEVTKIYVRQPKRK